ncbi:class I SAM-dependent methyltransferase [Paenibacillus sp. SC116]|uniref:class I SAM-dependent methyltransferase n=1 Tax=Paenibacillus sp. SC116 TaxID=2968986 RepID=UPI00215A6B05|nr:class I SAM-dependent methyltransferase [Paenibacillus sp. SC116]MCR8843401.1 class I SAM-dependent methyltransferase [Paenibacillus sp. SC116]
MDNTTTKDYLDSDQEVWDQEYKNKEWDYLADITEFARYSIVYGYIRKYLSTNSKGILDMGCGTGILYDMLLDSEKEGFTGVDLSTEAIKIASQKSPTNTFQVGNILDYTPQKQYDIIVFNESLHYVTNTAKVLLAYSNHLTSNGVIISSLYSHKNTNDPAYTIIENKIAEMENSPDFEVLDKVSLFNHKAELKWYLHLLKRKDEDVN